jgi:hypothetical protein
MVLLYVSCGAGSLRLIMQPHAAICSVLHLSGVTWQLAVVMSMPHRYTTTLLTRLLLCPDAIAAACPAAAAAPSLLAPLMPVLVHMCLYFWCRALGSISKFIEDHGRGLHCQVTLISWDDGMNCTISTFGGNSSDLFKEATGIYSANSLHELALPCPHLYFTFLAYTTFSYTACMHALFLCLLLDNSANVHDRVWCIGHMV